MVIRLSEQRYMDNICNVQVLHWQLAIGYRCDGKIFGSLKIDSIYLMFSRSGLHFLIRFHTRWKDFSRIYGKH